MKYLIIYSVIVTGIAITMTYNVVRLLEVNEVTVLNECQTVEARIRAMSLDDINKLMIVTSETLTEHYMEETREQVQKEHQDYSNRLAVEHMNDVVGILVKSIGSMPTSTLPY